MIRLSQVTLRRGAKVLLEGADLALNAGEKIGLIGANGSGKSSLFALLRGELHADQGEVDYPARWRVAHVAQETPALERPALEYAIDGDTRAAPSWSRSSPRPKPPSIPSCPACAGRAACRAGRRGRLHGALARRAAPARPGFHPRADERAGGELLRRLAHAVEPRAGADVPVRPAAARRAHQSPRSRRDPVGRGLAEALRRHAPHRLARPRLPRRRRERRREHRQPQAAALLGQLFELRGPARRGGGARDRPVPRSSSASARTWNRSSTASGPRPRRRGRRKAA